MPSSAASSTRRCFEALPDTQVRYNVRLAEHTTYRVGGDAGIWIEPQTEISVGLVMQQIDRMAIPLLVLGGGSNVVVSDQGWEGAVVRIGPNLAGWDIDDRRVTVKAGTPLMDLVSATVNRGLAGMESMAGIPGTVGGALRMNAGAYGQEIEQITLSVCGYLKNGDPIRFDRKDIRFGYRTAPELENVIITSAVLQLRHESTDTLRDRMEEILERRSARQPLEYPSCGSVFKRPPGDYAGRLIEAAGLKDARIGQAMVSPKHAGFIVNLGGASADDIHRLIRHVQATVADRFGVTLEPEVKIIGQFGS